jgi:hypothetical protein
MAPRIGAIFVCAESALPLMSNCTRTEWWSFEMSPAFGLPIGETMFVTSGCSASASTTCATAIVGSSCS